LAPFCEVKFGAKLPNELGGKMGKNEREKAPLESVWAEMMEKKKKSDLWEKNSRAELSLARARLFLFSDKPKGRPACA